MDAPPAEVVTGMVRAPAEGAVVGMNATVTEQDAPGASAAQLLVAVKLEVTEVVVAAAGTPISSATALVLVRVTDC